MTREEREEREEAIKIVEAVFDMWEWEFGVADDCSKEHKARDMAIEALQQEPCTIEAFVTPQPKRGRWIIKDGKEQGYDIAGIKTWYIQILCDKCGFIKTAIEGHTGQYNYCPNCGAKMEAEE